MAGTVTATGLFGSLASTDQDCTDHLGPPTPRVLEHGLKHGREPNFVAFDFRPGQKYRIWLSKSGRRLGSGGTIKSAV